MHCKKHKYLNPDWLPNSSLNIWMLTLQSILCIRRMCMQYGHNKINMDNELKPNNRPNAIMT